MGFTAAGINKDLVTTDQQAPLGFELTVPTANAGNQIWIYVQCVTVALAEGLAAMRPDGAITYTATPTTIAVNAVHPNRIIGVAQHAIAINSYGFILKNGLGSVQAGNGAVVAANTGLTTAGTGVDGTFAAAVTSTSNPTLDTHERIIAWCVTASAASGPAPAGIGKAMIDCRG